MSGTAALYALMVAASFARVFLRAFQQLNVVHGHRRWVVPTSYGMALAEILTQTPVAVVAVTGVMDPEKSLAALAAELLIAAAAVGTGAWMGALAAMTAHRRMGLS